MLLNPAQTYKEFHNMKYPRTYDPITPELQPRHKAQLKFIKETLDKQLEQERKNRETYAKYKLKQSLTTAHQSSNHQS